MIKIDTILRNSLLFSLNVNIRWIRLLSAPDMAEGFLNFFLWKYFPSVSGEVQLLLDRSKCSLPNLVSEEIEFPFSDNGDKGNVRVFYEKRTNTEWTCLR